MPELVLHRTIQFILDSLEKDTKTSNDSEMILHDIFGKDSRGLNSSILDFNFFTQAKKIFLEHKPKVYFGFNPQPAELPAIHIILPGETGKPLTIGADQGYQESEIDSHGVSDVFTEVFQSNYQVVVTSDNSTEVILIYNVLKFMFLSLVDHWEMSGLRLPVISGQDINLQGDIAPPNIYHRALGFSFEYEVEANSIFYKKMIQKLKFTPTVLEITASLKI